jgi:hypothetical protein
MDVDRTMAKLQEARIKLMAEAEKQKDQEVDFDEVGQRGC